MFSNLNLRAQKSAWLIIASMILVFGSIVTFAYTAKAQDATQEGGSGLSISPTRTELSLIPGSKDEVVVTIRNITSGPIMAKIFVNDFEPDNETGEPKIIVDPEVKSASSISSFLSVPEDIELQPDEAKDISIPVNIPENVAPGGYYGAVRFQALPIKDGKVESGGSQVSLTANLLSLVLIDVPGEIEQKVAVQSVKPYLDAKTGVLFTKKPNMAGVTIDNQGNSFVKPFGRVTLKNMRGGEVFSYELNNSNPRSNVLPESSRIFKDRLMIVEKKTVNGQEETEERSPITLPGRYTLTADVSYGGGGEVFTVTSSFWYFPVWFVGVLLAMLAALLIAVGILYRKYGSRTVKGRR